MPAEGSAKLSYTAPILEAPRLSMNITTPIAANEGESLLKQKIGGNGPVLNMSKIGLKGLDGFAGFGNKKQSPKKDSAKNSPKSTTEKKSPVASNKSQKSPKSPISEKKQSSSTGKRSPNALDKSPVGFNINFPKASLSTKCPPQGVQNLPPKTILNQQEVAHQFQHLQQLQPPVTVSLDTTKAAPGRFSTSLKDGKPIITKPVQPINLRPMALPQMPSSYPTSNNNNGSLSLGTTRLSTSMANSMTNPGLSGQLNTAGLSATLLPNGMHFNPLPTKATPTTVVPTSTIQTVCIPASSLPVTNITQTRNGIPVPVTSSSSMQGVRSSGVILGSKKLHTTVPKLHTKLHTTSTMLSNNGMPPGCSTLYTALSSKLLALDLNFDGDFTLFEGTENEIPMYLRVQKPTHSGETGLRVWDAGIVYAKATSSALVKDKKLVNIGESKVSSPNNVTCFNKKSSKERLSVLELGSGSGIGGLALALAGHNVILSDKACIKQNLDLNAEMNRKNIYANGGSVQTMVLDWSDSPEKWKSLTKDLDLITASDVVWAATFIHPFLSAVKYICSEQKKKPQILFSSKTRDPKVDQSFLLTLADYGLKVNWKKLSGGLPEKDPYYHPDVTMYELEYVGSGNILVA